jgi:hypothetical protein
MISAAAGINNTILYANNPQINEDCSNIYIGEVPQYFSASSQFLKISFRYCVQRALSKSLLPPLALPPLRLSPQPLLLPTPTTTSLGVTSKFLDLHHPC